MKSGCSNGIFRNFANLISQSTDILKCFRGSFRLRDNESQLYSTDKGVTIISPSLTFTTSLLLTYNQSLSFINQSLTLTTLLLTHNQSFTHIHNQSIYYNHNQSLTHTQNQPLTYSQPVYHSHSQPVKINYQKLPLYFRSVSPDVFCSPLAKQH